MSSPPPDVPRGPWVVAIVLGGTWLATELLPVTCGTGDDATWDWSFGYVTLRFIALPLLSCGLVIADVACSIEGRRLGHGRQALMGAASLLAPGGSLGALLACPEGLFVRLGEGLPW